MQVVLRNIHICVARLNAFADELDDFNETLSLAVDGTELQNNFEHQMIVDFELIDTELGISYKLYCLPIFLENFKSNNDSSRKYNRGIF